MTANSMPVLVRRGNVFITTLGDEDDVYFVIPKGGYAGDFEIARAWVDDHTRFGNEDFIIAVEPPCLTQTNSPRGVGQ